MISPREYELLEETTGRYTALMVDQDGITPLGSDRVETLTLSLYVIQTDGSLYYFRNAQDVLNTNNVTLDPDGHLLWLIQTSDTTIIEPVPFERHVALFSWSWEGGTKVGRQEVIIVVQNLTEVP